MQMQTRTHEYHLDFPPLTPTQMQMQTHTHEYHYIQRRYKFTYLVCLQELYHLGCRSIVVVGVPPIGCLPLQMTVKLHLLRTCVDQQNSDAKSYNQKLASLIPRLESSLPESKIMYASIYTPLSDMMDNPHKYGEVNQPSECI